MASERVFAFFFLFELVTRVPKPWGTTKEIE